MFSKLLDERVPEGGRGSALWNQCLDELLRVKGSQSFPLSEVDRLAILVSHRVRGDFQLAIQEVVSEVLNGFTDDLPF